MFRIAVCDDEKEEMTRLQGVLLQIEARLAIEFEVDMYSDGKELCEKCAQSELNYYEVIFLDIIMAEKGGISAGHFIRGIGWEETVFIFVSSYDKYLRQLFELGTYGFIDKPFTQASVEASFLPVYDKIVKRQATFFQYTRENIKHSIRSREIVYFEMDSHLVTMHLYRDGKYTEESFYEAMKSIWEKVKTHPQFIMPNKSNIINMEYVEKIDNKGTILWKDIKLPVIPIGRTYRELTMKRYLNYLGWRYQE